MRWTPGGRSRNLEDRRGASPGGAGRGPGGGMKLGLGGVVVLLVLSLVTGTDLLSLFGGAGGSGVGAAPGAVTSSPAPINDESEEELVQFVSFVLDDSQDMWREIFAASGQQYTDATLVLYRRATQSACGLGQSASGPFYCPGDGKVYIDLAFFEELHTRFGAPGDFARAYVLAHEIGHHVQNLLGTEATVRQQQRARPGDANRLSVAMELQADCYAGLWGRAAARDNRLVPGDLEAGLAAAAAVGDDNLQRNAGQRVNPDAFTHGTSAERVRWFRAGFDTGDPQRCDPFASR